MVCDERLSFVIQCRALDKGMQLIPGYRSDEDSVLRERV